MGRRELLGLIEATSASVHQRITARMPAVRLDTEPEITIEPEAHRSSPDFVVRFHVPAAAVEPRKPGVFLIAVSFAVSMAAGMGLAALIM